MQQHLIKEQILELSQREQQKLAQWWQQPFYDDTLVRVFIPQEQEGEYEGIFEGMWDKEYEFIYPELYRGKLKNHRGLIVPLLSIGEMIELLSEHDNNALAFRIHLLIRESHNKWIFDADALCRTLWEGVKTIVRRT